MPNESVLFHVRRADKLKSQRAIFDLLWQELAEFLLPYKSNILRRRPQGAKQTDRLFASAPIKFADLLAATMQGSVTSPAAPWFRLRLREKALNDVKQVRD